MRAHLFPNSSLASQSLVALFLWFGSRNFDYSTVELALIHVVDCFLGIMWELKFDITKASVKICRRWEFGLRKRDINNLAKREKSFSKRLRGDSLIKPANIYSAFEASS